MRKPFLWTICLLAVSAAPAAAQTPAPNSTKQRISTSRTEANTFVKPVEAEAYLRSRMPMANKMVYERAAYRDRQRMARLEVRKWRGSSAHRPFAEPIETLHCGQENCYGWVPTHSAQLHVDVP